jgi:hypothetical protein
MRITIFDTLSTIRLQDATECLTRQAYTGLITIHLTIYRFRYDPYFCIKVANGHINLFIYHHPLLCLYAKGYISEILEQAASNRAITCY